MFSKQQLFTIISVYVEKDDDFTKVVMKDQKIKNLFNKIFLYFNPVSYRILNYIRTKRN